MSTPYQAVFFDFGGTLFSYRTIAGQSIALIIEAAEKIGVNVEPGEAAMAYHRATKEVMADLMQQPYFLHKELFISSFKRFAELLGGQSTPDLEPWFYEGQRSALVNSYELRSDCLSCLGQLRDRNLHLAIVSNIDEDFLHPMLEREGLKEIFHSWTSSEEARSCKPSPAIYQMALDKAGCNPEEVLFVGDSQEQDIAGARALGMMTALIRDGDAAAPGAGALDASPPHYVIDELSELHAIIDGGNKESA
jgi:putative hydrolase of the HAD superfamily